MKGRNVTHPGQAPQPTGDVRPVDGAPEQAPRENEAPDAIAGAELLRILEGHPHLRAGLEDEAATPRVARMPEGIKVVEQHMGTAHGQWVLRVTCQCGRSWFEVEAVHWGTCPRCGSLVRVQLDSPAPPK